jgi:hypothetical protein
MATTAKCGSSGSVSLGGEISNWVVSLEQDAPETTSMLSLGDREYIPCLKSASGSFDSFISIGAIGARASVDFVNDTETISCDVILTDVAVSTPVDGAVTFKYSFVSTGEVTIA